MTNQSSNTNKFQYRSTSEGTAEITKNLTTLPEGDSQQGNLLDAVVTPQSNEKPGGQSTGADSSQQDKK